jgi:uncharacterized protein (TIGR01370 family)
MDDANLSVANLQALTAQNKQVFTYLSIGEAEDYRDYWGANGLAENSGFVLGEDPDWQGNYYVKFWDPGWQSLMFAKVDEAVANGYDGMYLDLVDAYGVGQVESAYTGPGDVRQAMLDFVVALSEQAKAIDPTFKVIPQNAVGLLAVSEDSASTPNTAYLNAIDGLGVEDLWFNDDDVSDWTQSDLQFLQLALDAGKFVLATSYPTEDAQQQQFIANMLAAGLIPFVADRELTGVIDSDNLTTQALLDTLDIVTPWDGVIVTPTDPTAPTPPPDPTVPTDPTFPTDPTDPVDPTVPTDPTAPPPSAEGLRLHGSSRADVLTGGAGDDYLDGRRGGDVDSRGGAGHP